MTSVTMIALTLVLIYFGLVPSLGGHGRAVTTLRCARGKVARGTALC